MWVAPINLPNRDFYLKLMIDGVSSKAFGGRALNPANPTSYESERSQNVNGTQRKVF